MKFKVFTSIFSIIVGLAIIFSWIMILSSGEMSELDSSPATAYLHILSELMTAILLILGSYGILRSARWAGKVHLVSLGMLIYAATQASGYYFQEREFILVALFSVIVFTSIFFIYSSIRKGLSY